MSRILSLRELNRTLLARQMLLARENIPVTAAIERLAGMQAQQASNPFVALWSRVDGFTREALAGEIMARKVVKATMMRGTLHLVTAADYLRFRGAVQAALTAGQENITARRGQAVDVETLVTIGREFLSAEPRSYADLSKYLESLHPDMDAGAMRYTVRMHLPMVQHPAETRWSYPASAKFTLADAWLGQPVPDTDDLPGLIKRYLAAFGPAGVTDIQKWSGIGKLGAAVDAMRGELVVYSDGGKRELFDLPDSPLPEGDTPAPVRFLPDFDNILLSHTNRTRIIAEAHHAAVFLPNLRVKPTVLIDGFVGGTWMVEVKRGVATLTVTPFSALSKPDRAAAEVEGESLVRFMEPDAKGYAVRVGE